MERDAVKMAIVQMPVDELNPYPNNAKTHTPDQVSLIAESIRRFGFQQPIVVDKDNEVIIGHGRLLAAQEMGLETVPVVRADQLTKAEAAALRLYDNKLNESAWDFGKLEEEIAALEIQGVDLSGLEFDLEEMETHTDASAVQEDDFDPDEPVAARVKRGDIWQLGRHRLMCGDSTNREDVETLMNGEKVELLLTDPPYGIKADKGFSGAVGFDGKGQPIERRHYKDDWDSERPSKNTFLLACELAKESIIFGGNFFTDLLPVGNHWLVWNKHNTMPTFSDAELAWTNIKRNSVKIYDVEWNGLIGKEKERFHPTQKPIKLFSGILNDYTGEEDSVVDLFGGSGSTLIACEQTGRKCYMMELDPHYCDVIIKRWEDLTGGEAVLVNG